MSALPIDTVLDLIQTQGTLEQASNFLKEYNVASSASSWADMREKRLKPPLESGLIPEADLLRYLAEVEEHGDQHVLLFQKLKKANNQFLFDANSLQKILAVTHPHITVNRYSFSHLPDNPTLIEVRIGEINGLRTCIFKIVESRFALAPPEEYIEDGYQVTRRQRNIYRAVNVVRFREDGLVDMRIFSHRDVADYEATALTLWTLLGKIVSRDDYHPRPLDAAKDALWDPTKRASVEKLFSIRASHLRNGSGNRVQAATGPVGNSMLDDPDLVASVDRFHNKPSGSYVDRTSCALKASGSKGILARDIGLVIHGAPHEYILTSHITRREYEYVLEQLLTLA